MLRQGDRKCSWEGRGERCPNYVMICIHKVSGNGLDNRAIAVWLEAGADLHMVHTVFGVHLAYGGFFLRVSGGRFANTRVTFINPLTTSETYRGRTAPLTFKVAFYIFIQQI